MPAVLGREGAGVVEAVGPGVSEVKAGQRVAYSGGPTGAYAEAQTIPADRLIALPEGIDDRTAAAMMLKGLTVRNLILRTHRVAPGEAILVHAAAGGVGLILCQWAKQLGATVIGTVGSDEKAALADACGCDHTIVYTREDFVARVREITSGEGVAVVYDSVGKATYPGSLDCLRPMGLMVSFGAASGPIPPVEPDLLSAKGSLFFNRHANLFYTRKREDLVASAEDLFAVVAAGQVRIHLTRTYALEDAARAHRDLKGRKTTGSSIFVP
jgi:NADPH2:quinone reductase